MYKIVIYVANIQHNPWWNGKSTYQFDTLNEVIQCLKTIFPENSIKDWELNRMIEADKKYENRNIAHTSWYKVIKGKEQMTWYTSF